MNKLTTSNPLVMKKNLFLTALAGAIVLTGCSKSEILETELDRKAIGFENFMHRATRATEITGSNVTSESFSIQCYYNDGTDFYTNQTLSYAASAWNTTTTKYWPYDCVTEGSHTATKSLGFFAYNAGSFSKNGYTGSTTKPTLTYTVAATATSQKDVLAGYVEGRIWQTDNSTSIVPLTFNHILSEICFTLVGENDDYQYDVTNLTIGGDASGTAQLYPTGTYTFGQDAGVLTSLTGAKTTYSYSGTPALTLNADASATAISSDVLMLIPQAATSSVIKVTYKVTDPTTNIVLFEGTKATGTLSETWQNGKKYTYAITLPTGAHAIQYSVAVNGWETESVTSDLELN